MTQPSEQKRREQDIEAVRDELAGWPIGSGYYSTGVSVDEATGMAEKVADLLAAARAEAIAPYVEREKRVRSLAEEWRDMVDDFAEGSRERELALSAAEDIEDALADPHLQDEEAGQ